ncbi:MAG: hypothetical protein V1793_18670 [Pseudomonadota bacterium]
MADTMTDADSLISQDDIDKLLNAVSLDEGGEDDGATDFSQDDIDSLLDGIATGGGGTDVPKDASPDQTPSAGAGTAGPDDLELISQDDIDKLLNSTSFSEPEPAPAPSSVLPEDPDDGAEFSQDDIDKLLSGSGSQGLPAGDAPDDDALEMISLEDVKRVVSPGFGAAIQPPDQTVQDAVPLGSVPGSMDRGEPVLDESEAVSIQDCLITQETLDRLIQADKIKQDEDASQPDVTVVDLDVLVKEETEAREVSQEDIDKLLNTSEKELAEDVTEGSALISQEDINELLKGTLEDDEDILGDNYSGEPDGHSPERDMDTGTANQVVLEEAVGGKKEVSASRSISETRDTVTLKQPRLSRRFLVAASVILLLGILVPSGYYVYRLHSGSQKFDPPVAAVVQVRNPERETVTVKPAPVVVPPAPVVESPEPFVDKGPGSLVLERFMVLVPSGTKGSGYIQVDVSIHYTTSRVFDEIQKNIPRFRDVVYEAMGRSLASDKGDTVTEADLLGAVKNALTGVLHGNGIEKVTFALFKTG